MSTGLILVLVVAASAAITYGHAAHDVAAARRFRGLAAKAVATDTDKLRNRRWHAAGWALRASAAVLIGAVVGLALGRWSSFFLALAVAGAVSAALFDVLFAIKFGQAWDYLGTTAVADVKARARLTDLVKSPGRAQTLAEAALVVVCCGAFLLWAR